MNKITAGELRAALDDSPEKYDKVFNKWFGVGEADHDIQTFADDVDQLEIFKIATPSECFFAGIIATLTLLETRKEN